MNETMHFLTQHGTIVLFAAVLAEQIGLPLPAVPFLIAAGALVGTGQMSLSVAVVAAVVAALLGDQVWFELGRRRGRRVLNWLCRISLEPTSCVRRTEDFFARHGVRSLVVAKFVPGLSTIAPPLAGIVGLRVPQYLLYNGLGTVLWVGSGIGFGYAFSDQLEQSLSLIAHLGPAVGLILLGGVTSYVVYRTLQWHQVEHVVLRLTPQQVREKIAAGEDPLIIDLRPLGDRQEIPGIPGSLTRSLEELVTGHRDLPQDRDVILYCACPKDAASIQAAGKLREQGFTRVWPLAGGIDAWRAVSGKNREAIRITEVRPNRKQDETEGAMDRKFKFVDLTMSVALVATVVGVVLCLFFLFAPATFGKNLTETVVNGSVDIQVSLRWIQPILGQAIVEDTLIKQQHGNYIDGLVTTPKHAMLVRQQTHGKVPETAIAAYIQGLEADHATRVQWVLGRLIVTFTSQGIRTGMVTADKSADEANRRIIALAQETGTKLNDAFKAARQARIGTMTKTLPQARSTDNSWERVGLIF